MRPSFRSAVSILNIVPVVLAGFFGVANAQNMIQPTLERIRENGVIYVAHRESSVPFSYYHGDEVVGYSKDLCDKVVAAIKQHLNEPSLKVVLVPVSSNTRLMALVTGMVDLECGSTTNTKIRQQTVAFSVTTFVTGIRAMVREDSGIKQLGDLNGKTIVTTAGTTTERVVKTALTQRKMIALEKSGLSHADSYQRVSNRAVDAFVIDDILLSGLIANATDGVKMTILEENMGFEPYGIAMRRNDPEFKTLVDSTLIGLMKSGELEAIYNKWFLSPIPPYGVSLNVPMSGLLKEAIRVPNDTGI
jgi:glutamate/aspartate transport system substrate-binding protein